MVKGIAEAHGGSVRVESTAKNGSRFIVRLPLTSRSHGDSPIECG
jgi:signal transduction histidine kinase